MFTRPPSEHELAAAGLTVEDFDSGPVEVWPENWRAFDLFCSIRTQWRVGIAGPTGLDYNTLFHKLDRMSLEPEEYDQLEADVRAMEYAALAAMNEKD